MIRFVMIETERKLSRVPSWTISSANSYNMFQTDFDARIHLYQLTYTSEHLLYTWKLLLKCIDDASTGIRRCRYEIRSRSQSRSSSILDHFPNNGRSNIERMQSKYRCISLIYKSEHLLYTWILLLKCIVDAMICTCRGRDEIRP